MTAAQSSAYKPLPWTTKDVLDATSGTLLSGNDRHFFSSVSIDSRKIAADELFVAIRGEVHDGHKFVPDIVASGVRGLILDHQRAGDFPLGEWKENGIFCVSVADTTAALGKLANFNRERADIPVVAITGSNGKTTTRKMMAEVTGQRFSTLATRGNLNNEIGLPLTLLTLSKKHECAVLELGMNHPGEMRRLGNICQPDVAMITNVAPAHLEGLGSLEGVAAAKGELLENIRPKGSVILNADDPLVFKLAKQNGIQSPLLFGFSEAAAIRAVSVKVDETCVCFTLVLPEETIPIRLGIPARFMVSNALAAASAGVALGLSADEIRAGLENFKSVRGRMNILRTAKGVHLVDDTYNANPGSMEAAIMTVKSLRGKAKSIFVAGDMFELGDHAEALHQKVGRIAARAGMSRIYATGAFAAAVASGANDQGMNVRNIFTGTKEEIVEELGNTLEPGDWLLVKGSRAMKMEEIVEVLK